MVDLPKVPRRFVTAEDVQSRITPGAIVAPYAMFSNILDNAADLADKVGEKMGAEAGLTGTPGQGGLGSYARAYEKAAAAGAGAALSNDMTVKAAEIQAQFPADPAAQKAAMTAYGDAQSAKYPDGSPAKRMVQMQVDQTSAQMQAQAIGNRVKIDTANGKDSIQALIERNYNDALSLARQGRAKDDPAFKVALDNMKGGYDQLGNPLFNVPADRRKLDFDQKSAEIEAQSIAGQADRLVEAGDFAKLTDLADQIEKVPNLEPTARARYSAVIRGAERAGKTAIVAAGREVKQDAEPVLAGLKAGTINPADSQVEELIGRARAVGRNDVAKDLNDYRFAKTITPAIMALPPAQRRAAIVDLGQRALPAGMRNNNPGNIKFIGTDAAPGIVGPSVNTDQGDPQAVFASQEAGMAAMGNLLIRKFDGGKKTADQIIAGESGWTPGNHQAAANVARTMGVSPDTPLDLRKPEQLQSFMRALIRQEHGPSGDQYSDALVAKGADLALNGGQPNLGGADDQVGKDIDLPGEETPSGAPLATRGVNTQIVLKAGEDVSRLSPGARGMVSGILADGVVPELRINAGFETGGHAKASQHYHGNAIDVSTVGWTDEQKAAFIQSAIKNGAKGIGIYPSGRVIHIDTRQNPTFWGPNPAGMNKGASLDQAPAWARPALAALFNGGGGGAPQVSQNAVNITIAAVQHDSQEQLNQSLDGYLDTFRKGLIPDPASTAAMVDLATIAGDTGALGKIKNALGDAVVQGQLDGMTRQQLTDAIASVQEASSTGGVDTATTRAYKMLQDEVKQREEMREKDPIGLAVADHQIPAPSPLDWSNQQGTLEAQLRARSLAASVAAPHAELSAVSIFRPAEKDAFSTFLQQAPADQVLGALGNMARTLPGDTLGATMRDIAGDKNARTYVVAASLAAQGQTETAKAIITGQRIIAQKPDLVAETFVKGAAPVTPLVLPRALYAPALTNASDSGQADPYTDTVNAAKAIYAAGKGPDGTKDFDETLWRQSVERAVGGFVFKRGMRVVNAGLSAPAEGNGQKIIAPVPGMTQDEFAGRLAMVREGDLNKMDDGLGNTLKRSDFLDMTNLEALGSGRYLLRLGKGYVRDRASGQPFVLDLR